MATKNEIYNKLYASDIFNTKQNYTQAPAKVANPRARINHPTLENTKEEVFNVGKERRIKRNKEKKNNDDNNVLSHSVAKRKKNYDNIYGSDIFNQKRASSVERRRGVKQIPNVTNKSTLLNEVGNNEEYVKELKYYTNQHRTEKKEYNPDIYINKITPQERYYKQYYGNFGDSELNKEGNNKKLEDKKINDFIHNKVNLKNEINKYNNAREDKKGKQGEINYQEKRYFRQKPMVYEGKRKFVESNQYPHNNCKINKQIQMESHIFSNENKNKNFDEEVKAINDRLELEKNKHYHINVLGQPITKIDNKRESTDTNKSLYGSGNSRWGRTNLDWKSPEAEIMFSNTLTEGNKNISARERKIKQLADSNNIDTLSGIEKAPIENHKYKTEIQINNSGKKKMDEIIEDIPNLNEKEKLNIKLKTSSIDCYNDEEWNNKEKLLNDFYMNKKNKINKEKRVTGKVNDKKDRINKDLQSYNTSDNAYHDYVITYSTKGNQFEKFDENDIQKLFGARGIQTYDIHKDPFDKGKYNKISLKIKGNDNNNELYNKVKKVQNDLKKENYKINIEKGENIGKKKGKMLVKPGTKIAVLQENVNKGNEGSKYKIMPNEVRARKGFTKQFANMDYEYKKPDKI